MAGRGCQGQAERWRRPITPGVGAEFHCTPSWMAFGSRALRGGQSTEPVVQPALREGAGPQWAGAVGCSLLLLSVAATSVQARGRTWGAAAWSSVLAAAPSCSTAACTWATRTSAGELPPGGVLCLGRAGQGSA